MTSLKHVVLTGSPGVGKTTLVCKLVEYLKECHKDIDVRGFYTTEVREGGQRVGFDVVTLSADRFPLARKRAEGYGRGGGREMVGSYKVDVEAFGKSVLPIIQKINNFKNDKSNNNFDLSCSNDIKKGNKKVILVIDEIGKMELINKQFEKEIKHLFAEEFIPENNYSKESNKMGENGGSGGNSWEGSWGNSEVKDSCGNGDEVVVLATIPQRSQSGVVENIRSHPQVKLFEVTRGNRNDLKDSILETIQRILFQS